MFKALISKILGLSTPYLVIGGLVIALSITGLAFWKGYSWANDRCEAAQLELIQRFQRSVIELDAKLRVAEAELVERSTEREVIIKEVIKHVPQYVNTSACRLTDAGLHNVGEAARAAFASSK